MSLDPESDSALLVIDVQNDFCPGGSLAVAGGDEVVPALNRHIEAFQAAERPIIATRDWHPRQTVHFKEFGGLWPVHCVQGSRGAEFHPDLRLPPGAVVVSAGTGPDEQGYSAFEGQADDGRHLHGLLADQAVKRLYVGGLATDYCVKESVLDALKSGFEVVVLEDSVRAVNVQPGDDERAIQAMKAAGATVV